MSGFTVETDPEKIAAAIAKINQSPMLSKGNEESTGGLASENMTVWDEFYKSVMCGICASGPGITWSVQSLVADAAKFADAMMAERNKRGS